MKPIKPVVTALAMLLFASAVMAAAQDYPVECAQRDVQLATQIEQIGEAQSVPGDIMFEAFMTVMRARKACAQGRVALGLALYDSIFRTSLVSQMRVR
jgi:hypothetical protein